MAIDFGNWVTNPSELANQGFQRPLQGGTTPGKWEFTYQRSPTTGKWHMKRQWKGAWYADEPDAQEKGLSFLARSVGGQAYRSTSRPPGWNPNASQFPWQQRTGISSDASRQNAFRMGIGTGKTAPRLVAKSPSTYFDPRTAFNNSNIKVFT